MNIISCAKCPTPITHCDMHSHPNWEIVLHLSGSVTSVIGDNIYNISKGDISVIPPQTPHDGNSDIPYTDIYVQASNLDFFGSFITHDNDGSVFVLINMLHKILTEKENNYSHIADTLLETICQYIKKFSNTEIKYPFVNKIKNAIYNNLSNPDFNLAEAIAYTGFNSDYLRRCFKEETNKTPLEYMTELRINQAKTLLIHNTFISVENTAYSCGFNDSFYFSTCFKKHTGMSPLKYRKKHLT